MVYGQQQQYGGGTQGGTATYDTGVSSGPSLSQQQYQQYLRPYSQIGQAPMQRPVAPQYGSYGYAQATPTGGGLNQARSLLGQQAGSQLGNQFANQVNSDQSQLAANQAAANSSLGLGMQDALSSIYNGALNRGSQLNSGQASNAVRTSGLGMDLAGNLFGLQAGLAGQVVNPLMSGLFGGLSGLMGNLTSMGSGGGLGSLLSGVQSPLGTSGLNSLGSGTLASLLGSAG